jgi:hypothetical protein
MRVWSTYALMAVVSLALPAAAAAQNVERVAVGPNAAAIQATVDQFRADLGGGNIAGPNGLFGGLRREIDWDSVPDALASPAAFPGNYFNTTSPRGLLLATFGANAETRVSQDDNTGNDADPDLVRFGDVSAALPGQFQTFSAQRLVGAVGTDSLSISFRIPGTDTPAVVRGFGVVLTGINGVTNDHNVANVTWFDPSGELLASIAVAPGAMAFVGVSMPIARIATVNITLGNLPLDEGPETPDITDIVAADDFIYAEPVLAKEVLSEGATGAFFDTDLALANPTGTDQIARLTFLKEDGNTITVDRNVPARARLTIPLESIPGLEATAVSTIVTPLGGRPMGVERTMFWGENRYGGHTGISVPGASKQWLFAEGAQGFFDTFILVTNENDAPTTVTFTFLRENEAPFVTARDVGAHSRLTLHAGTFPELTGRSFGLIVDSPQPIGAERAMYFGSTQDQFWKGGHESPGARQPWFNWYFAEGATGAFWDTYILMINPHDVAVPISVTFLREAGAPIEVQKVIGPKQRLTINPEFEAQALESASAATELHADLPIVVERSMYWTGGDGQPWTEGHNSTGQNFPTFAHLLTEGRVGGPEEFRTYILLSTISANPTPVRLVFFRENGLPSISKNVVIAPNSRLTFDVAIEMPELQNESFSTYVRSNGGGSFLVERSIYWNAGGVFWAGGSSGSPAHMPQTLFVP